MYKQYYEVIEEFDSKKDYGIEIRRQYAECLSVLKKGEKVNPLDIAKQYLNSFTKKPRKFETNKDIAYHSFGIAKKLGMLKKIPKEQRDVANIYRESLEGLQQDLMHLNELLEDESVQKNIKLQLQIRREITNVRSKYLQYLLQGPMVWSMANLTKNVSSNYVIDPKMEALGGISVTKT